MEKVRIRLVLALLTLTIYGVTMYSVVTSEYHKSLQKKAADEKAYAGSIKDYQKVYSENLLKQKEANKKAMELAKAQYQDLLAKQSELIKQHTTTTTVTIPTSTTQANSSNTTTVKKTRSTKSS